jgi:hypothetical protein
MLFFGAVTSAYAFVLLVRERVRPALAPASAPDVEPT